MACPPAVPSALRAPMRKQINELTLTHEQGAELLYNALLRPFLNQHEAVIEDALARTQEHADAMASRVRARVGELAVAKSGDVLAAGAGLMARLAAQASASATAEPRSGAEAVGPTPTAPTTDRTDETPA